MNRVQITNGFYEAKAKLEESLKFFNEMMSEYGNIENVLYDECKDAELDVIREDLSSIDDTLYCLNEAIEHMKRININIDYEL